MLIDAGVNTVNDEMASGTPDKAKQGDEPARQEVFTVADVVVAMGKLLRKNSGLQAAIARIQLVVTQLETAGKSAQLKQSFEELEGGKLSILEFKTRVDSAKKVVGIGTELSKECQEAFRMMCKRMLSDGFRKETANLLACLESLLLIMPASINTPHKAMKTVCEHAQKVVALQDKVTSLGNVLDERIAHKDAQVNSLELCRAMGQLKQKLTKIPDIPCGKEVLDEVKLMHQKIDGDLTAFVGAKFTRSIAAVDEKVTELVSEVSTHDGVKELEAVEKDGIPLKEARAQLGVLIADDSGKGWMFSVTKLKQDPNAHLRKPILDCNLKLNRKSHTIKVRNIQATNQIFYRGASVI